jgi:hypothetical protein
MREEEMAQTTEKKLIRMWFSNIGLRIFLVSFFFSKY